MAGLDCSSFERDFEAALTYALKAIGNDHLVLKKEQKEAMTTVFRGEDGLPTGFGKSVCYESLPFLFDFKLGRTSVCDRSTVIVISPLMIDQVTSLRKRGVSTAILSGREGVDKDLLATDKELGTPGKYSLLFCAPEAVIESERWSDKFLDFPLSDRIVAIAVDEAYCVSRWYVLNCL
jgi:ATP-dependent DNA helicase RecQ